MSLNRFVLIGVIYITLLTGMAIGMIGDMPNSPATPWDWKAPISIFVVTAVPFGVGILAGLEGKNEN